MIPCQYSESIAVAQIPAHQDHACVTYCDLETNTRCKTGVTIGPGLCPTSFRDSIIVYMDSTRRRYVSRVEYSTRMKPLSYSDTTYARPRVVANSFAAWVDHRSDTHRKWYKSSVRLEPKVYSSTQEYKMAAASDRKSEVSLIGGGLTDQDASMESLEYLSDGPVSSPEVPSPLRINDNRQSPLDNSWTPEATTTTTTSGHMIRATSRSHHREVNGNSREGLFDTGSSQDSNANEVVSHRSGPFIYNAPKRRGGQLRMPHEDEDDDEDAYPQQVNGDLTSNGVTQSLHMNGYHTYQDHPYLDDMVDL